MIWTVVQINLRRLRHSRVELLLSFVVPLAFFSIFAVIFGGGIGGQDSPRIKVLTVDAAGTARSAAVLARLADAPGLQLFALPPPEHPDGKHPDGKHPDGERTDRERRARQQVRRGEVVVALLLEDGPEGPAARLLADASDPIAAQLVSAITAQAISVTARSTIPPTPPGKPAPPGKPTPPGTLVSVPGEAPAARRLPAEAGLSAPRISVEDVLRGDESKPAVSMYAAGIAVMFLLFGASGGGGALLEEQENGTLERLFATRLTMDQLLLGKWVYQLGLGVVQTTLMFLWGQWVFGIDLLGHWQGFTAMTLVTAGAAASFGLLLATLCRTRNQLNGLSVILVLSMSALGGSMVPRYLMGEGLQRAGLWTFNAWALDGYNKVFWRELPLAELWPQISVLVASGFVFLMAARALAVRWETG
ncbi:ABC transporter permease [Roseimaritima sediminicola]|uniref:ABC transporter permease n=1 Tax=Roseimaritima sediminicola TaxID=2662066 RepID=UPI0012983821|nr:ABC transporter permease [Roseimaritima sediminicola]